MKLSRLTLKYVIFYITQRLFKILFQVVEIMYICTNIIYSIQFIKYKYIFAHRPQTVSKKLFEAVIQL